MQLKALDISGFKSFPDRIELQFGGGITAVVGPNGSGKSNIADAMRWVLGEQSGKTLRSDRMEDVIFSGTQRRRAMGVASVSLFIDNCDRSLNIDSDEVILGRKLYRSGESEYRINGSAVRLRDITELLMDTGFGRDGYSIIGQGRIAEIVGAKSTQRREIFEEAAGIGKYRYRREQAEKQLAAAQENLVRLRDILLELESRLEPLRAQSEKAREYLDYAGRKRLLEVSLWVLAVERSREKLRSEEDRLILAQNEHEKITESLDDIEREIQGLYDEAARRGIEMEKLREEGRQAAEREAELQKQEAVWENDLLHNGETIRRLEETEVLHEQGREDLERRLEENARAAGRKKEELQALDGRSEALASGRSDLLEERAEAERAAAELSAQKEEAVRRAAEERLKAATSEAMLEQLRQNALAAGSNARQSAREREDLRKELETVKELTGRIGSQIESQENVKKGLSMKRQSAEQKLDEIRAKRADLTGRQKGTLQKAKLIEEMENSLEGYQNSVRYIMNQARNGNLNGIEGPVSQLIRVEPRYASAVEVALGSAAQNIVVTTDSAAKVAIDSLKRARAGRATFLPMSVIRRRTLDESGLDACEGFVARADELAAFDPKYADIAGNLLGRTAVAEDIDSAVTIAKRFRYRFRVVTLDGQVVNPGGSMTGGSMAGNAGLLSRSGEIRRLRASAADLEKEISAAALQEQEAEEAISQIRAQILAAEADLRTMGEDRVRAAGERKRLEMAIETLDAQHRDAMEQARKTGERIDELKQQGGTIGEMLAKLADLEMELNGSLEEAKQRAAELGRSLAGLEEQDGSLKLERVALQKDLESIETLAAQLREQLDSQEGRQEELAAQRAYLERKNEAIRMSISSGKEEMSRLRQGRESGAAALARLQREREALEQRSSRQRSLEKELHARGELAARELARLEEHKHTVQAEYDDTIARLYDEYELTLTAALSERIELEDEAGAEKELTVLKSKIKALGSINVDAIEEYREVRGRYDEMKAQIDDVEHSRTELQKLIGELTVEMKVLFETSFREINRNFGEIFTELFSGGAARLILSEPEDVLESGIEIIAQPPGKLIKNLAALSGGEQAFVAIAIYFAILKVHPSPFCLLDEIEAALDDVNVTRYARYLRRLTDKTQFIAITHRRGTMEEADMLYGVTMQEEGVSKLLRMDAAEAERLAGAPVGV